MSFATQPFPSDHSSWENYWDFTLDGNTNNTINAANQPCMNPSNNSSSNESPKYSIRVSTSGREKGNPQDLYGAIINSSVPLSGEQKYFTRKVVWFVIDGKDAILEIHGAGKSDKIEAFNKLSENYTLHKIIFSKPGDYHLVWRVGGKEVNSANIVVHKPILSKSADSVPNTKQKRRTQPSSTLPNPPFMQAEYYIPKVKCNNVLLVTPGNDEQLHRSTISALRELDFTEQITCDDGRLCLYNRRGLTDDNIVILQYTDFRQIKVIDECKQVVDEVLFLLPADGTASISYLEDANNNYLPLAIKQMFNISTIIARLDTDVSPNLHEALLYCLQNSQHLNVGAAFSSGLQNEICNYLAKWTANCLPRHQKLVYLCFKTKHQSAKPISDVAIQVMQAIRSRIGLVNAEGYAYGCYAIFISCLALHQLFIFKEQYLICSAIEARGLTLTSIYQMDVRDVEIMSKDVRNKPFTFELLDLMRRMKNNGVPRNHRKQNHKRIIVPKHRLDAQQILRDKVPDRLELSQQPELRSNQEGMNKSELVREVKGDTVTSNNGSVGTTRPGPEKKRISIKSSSTNGTAPASPTVHTKKDNIFVQGATRAMQETKQDVKECETILSTHAADTTEMLHLIEDWMSGILKGEFIPQTERIKLRLLEKYRKGQLKGDKPDVGEKKKKLLHAILGLEKWKREGFDTMAAALTRHVDTSQGYLLVDNEKLKQSLDDSLLHLSQLNKCMTDIAMYRTLQQPNTVINSDALLHECEENGRLIAKMQDMNQKEKFTIVILGLEKAGKSTFVNTLLGAEEEIVPTNESRCTQVLTTILRSTTPGTSATIDFYSREQFEANILQRPKDGISESDIRRDCEPYVGAHSRSVNPGKDFSREVRRYIADESLKYVVKQVTVFTDKIDASVPFELVDVPGMDSPLSEHKKAVSEAIGKSDAFLLLMSGQRPSLTDPQINVLKSILSQHYDAMSSAFAGVTWLDTMHTPEVYKKHLDKCREELLRFNFPSQNIFPICSKLKLLQKISPNSAECAEMTKKVQMFPGLESGYDHLESDFQHVVKNELPVKRMHQAMEFAQKKLFGNVLTAIQLGRQYIPEHVNEETKLDAEIDNINAEQWGDVFASKRLGPTIQRALHWKQQRLIFHGPELMNELRQMFKEHFDKALAQSGLLESVESLDGLMLGNLMGARGLVLDHHLVEEEQRTGLVDKFIGVVQVVSGYLALDIYNKYIQEFVNILASICPEESDIFQTSRKVEHCQLEIWALLKRVAVPLIHATVRWPHDLAIPRNAAAQELARVVPWVAMQVCGQKNSTPQLAKLVGTALGFVLNANGMVTLPEEIVKLMGTLFPKD
eukprot:TRINITY_DN1103_c0_g1_i2.p1 TRINITY_DN1103_c0_g1~~TRINITY_DN1103_c0_g1_i2.p1  ORF type:complete len:1342 (-),score=302.46 TRINITY_DN1103_c0_g1_i2:675-4700(-)